MSDEKKVRVLFLDLNSYFASCEQQLRAELRGKPIAVVPSLVDSTFCIAASYEAKAFGVKTGTRVGDAKKMCPGLILVQARHKEYVILHHKIIEAVESCHPVHAVLSIDEMACRLKGSDQNVSKAIELAKHIKQTIYQKVGTQMRCSIGLAPNRFLSKVASNMQKPDGLTVITEDLLPQVLYPLKLIDLYGIGAQMQKRLHRKRVFSVEQLCGLSKLKMRELWGGIGGERYWNYIRGEDVFEEATRKRTIGHSAVLAPKNRTPDLALGVLKKLTLKAAVRLRRSGYFACSMAIKVKFVREGKWEKKVKFIETQDSFLFLKAILMMWKDIPQYKPIKVAIHFFNLVPADAHTPSLFSNPKKEGLSHLIDQVHEKYGSKALYFGGVHQLEGVGGAKIAFQRVPDISEIEE